MSTSDADFRRRAAVTRQRFGARYGALNDRARYAAMKSVEIRSDDPIEVAMAKQYIHLYDARGRVTDLQRQATETNDVRERESLLEEAERTLSSAVPLLEAEGERQLRAAEAAAVERYRVDHAAAEEVAQARSLAADQARASRVETLAARLAPAAEVAEARRVAAQQEPQG